jgi:hypothetical protein
VNLDLLSYGTQNTTPYVKEMCYGIVILLDNLGTRNRMANDLNDFLNDWVIVHSIESNKISPASKTVSGAFKIGIRMKDEEEYYSTH